MQRKLRNFLSHPITILSIVGVCVAFWLTDHGWWIVPFGLVVSVLAGYAWEWKEVEEELLPFEDRGAGVKSASVDIKWKLDPLDKRE